MAILVTFSDMPFGLMRIVFMSFKTLLLVGGNSGGNSMVESNPQGKLLYTETSPQEATTTGI